MDGSTYVEFLKIIVICIMWYLCSASNNIIGKVVLLDFPYPMTMTMVQLLSVSVFLAPFLPCVGANKEGSHDRRYLFTMILPLAFGKFITSVSSFVSIWKVSVSYSHTVKGTLPLFTVILAKFISRESQTLPVYLSLIPIIIGVGVATMTEATFDSMGLVSALISCFFFSLLTIFTKKSLKETGYHHLQLLLLICRIATICFLPFWAIADLPRILYNTQFLQSGHVMHTMFLLLADGLSSMLQNVFAFNVIALVSPLSFAVANATKRIVIIGGSILILQNSVSALNALGMFIAVFGVLCYNQARYNQMHQARREKILPYVHSDSNLHQLGVPHMPHSKSDANFFSSGGPAHVKDPLLSPSDATANGLVWHGKAGRAELMIHSPSEHKGEDGSSKLAAGQVLQNDPFQRLQSRSVHHV